MNIENFIEAQYRDLKESGLNLEFSDLYTGISHSKLCEVLSTLHYDLTQSFKTMNERLPAGDSGAHFWADPSRALIRQIEIALGLYNALKNSKYAFEFDPYYYELIFKCRSFLNSSGGSTLPANMQKVELYYIQPIFVPAMGITVSNIQSGMTYELKQIGSGSYANVYKYKDTFYNRPFVLKRAKKDLSVKELQRFKREYEEMREFSSPYILEVYCYNSEKNEYIMEYMDSTLDEYISKHNHSLSIGQRKGLVNQILRAFDYIHSKGRLHRDISPKNILMKEYDDVPVVKIADFGLVKIPDSGLTKVNTDFKGYFNDPALVVDGFDSYNILHETYALTRIICFVMTGKTNAENIKDPNLRVFVAKGLNPDKTKRFKSVTEMISESRKL